MKTTQRKDITIEDLRKFEKCFQVGGMSYGMYQLDKFICEFYSAHNPVLAAFIREMQKYDKPQLEDSPASDSNLPRQDKPGLNYFAPRMILTRTCQDEAFTSVRVDRKKHTDAWLEQCIRELMQSEYRDEIATLWSQDDQRLKLKGWVLGALRSAGVFKGSSLNMARLYYHTEENSAEVKTLAKYMGDKRHWVFDTWIRDYVLIH